MCIFAKYISGKFTLFFTLTTIKHRSWNNHLYTYYRIAASIIVSWSQRHPVHVFLVFLAFAGFFRLPEFSIFLLFSFFFWVLGDLGNQGGIRWLFQGFHLPRGNFSRFSIRPESSPYRSKSLSFLIARRILDYLRIFSSYGRWRESSWNNYRGYFDASNTGLGKIFRC